MKWSFTNSEQALRLLGAHGRPHRSLLWQGILWTLFVVLLRLAMPWPLRWVVELVFPEAQAQAQTRSLADHLPALGEPLLWLAGSYVVLAAGVGLAEMAQRVKMMQFAARTVHGMRSAVVSLVSRSSLREHGTGDLVARMVGDAARVKAGMAGVLVHFIQNGLLFVGICSVFLVVAPRLGVFFLGAGVLVVLIGVRTAGPVAASAHKHRRMEADYAEMLQELVDDDGADSDLEDLNLGSSEKEVKTTRLVTHSTFLAHLVLALTVGLALWVGARDVVAGRLEPGDIFLFIAYALIVHRRLVQVGRQIARSGKVLAAANRIGALLERARGDAAPGSASAPPAGLVRGLQLENVMLRSERSKAERPRLKLDRLSLRAGEHVAVVGGTGAGKSSLLRLIAGVEPPTRGTLFWDGTEVTGDGPSHRASVGYVSDSPAFPTQRLWRSLGLSGADALRPDQQQTLERVGAWSIIKRLAKGLEAKVASKDFSRNEARRLKLAATLLGDESPVWVIDGPVEGLGKQAAAACVAELIGRAGNRTLVVALSRPVGLECFDRVVGLRRGKLAYDGEPGGWKRRKADLVREAALVREAS